MFKKYIAPVKTHIQPVKLLVQGAFSYELQRTGTKAFGIAPLTIPKEKVITNNGFVNAKCGLLLVDTTTPAAICVTYNHEVSYRIFVNNAFNAQPKWFQRAIICHEEGHYNLGHMSDDCTKSSLEKELEADDYALRHGHDVLSSHMVTLNCCKYYTLNAEFITRIKALLNKVGKMHSEYDNAINVIKAYELAVKLKLI